MTAPVSVGTMLKQLAGMADTKDLSVWENDFLRNVLRDSKDGAVTSRLSENRIDVIERLWRKHFAG